MRSLEHLRQRIRFFLAQLANPHAHKPSFKFGTTPFTSTAMNLKENYNDMYLYMTAYNKPDVLEGIRATKRG